MEESGYLPKNITRQLNDEARMKELVILTHAVKPPGHLERKMEVHLEDALDMTGVGRYQVFHWAVMLFMVLASMLEMVGISFVLPAASCDLHVPDTMKGILASIPNIGVILTAPFWGRAADRYGRKSVLLLSAAAAGLLGLAAAAMPDLLSFALCKLVASLFLSPASSLTVAYGCELTPRRVRDRAVLATNGLLMVLSTFTPVFAWAVLSPDWPETLISVVHPWRILTVVYAIPLLLMALWLTAAEESPKYLMTRGRDQHALDVLQRIYQWNTGESPDDFGVKSLKTASECDDSLAPEELQSAWSLLQPPHLKWLALTGFLMFGLFSLLNGLFLLAPDSINAVMSGDQPPATVCAIINQPHNTTISSVCSDTISHSTFHIMMVTTLVYGCVVTAVSVSPLSKKTQLVGMYLVVSGASLLSALVTNRILVGMAMSALQVTALGIGPLTAYVVHLFPTTLRGTAMGAVMMFGRVGSAAGANAAGYFLAAACPPTFYSFTVLTLVCAALSLLLPGEQAPTDSSEAIREDSR